MKNKSGIPIIFALALVIGLIISIQLNTSDAHDQGGLIPIPIAQVDALEQQLKEVRREKEAILAEYLELEQRLKEIEEKISATTRLSSPP